MAHEERVGYHRSGCAGNGSEGQGTRGSRSQQLQKSRRQSARASDWLGCARVASADGTGARSTTSTSKRPPPTRQSWGKWSARSTTIAARNGRRLPEIAPSYPQLLQAHHRQEYGTHCRPCSEPHRKHRSHTLHHYNRRRVPALECIPLPKVNKAMSSRLHIPNRQRDRISHQRRQRLTGTRLGKST